MGDGAQNVVGIKGAQECCWGDRARGLAGDSSSRYPLKQFVDMEEPEEWREYSALWYSLSNGSPAAETAARWGDEPNREYSLGEPAVDESPNEGVNVSALSSLDQFSVGDVVERAVDIHGCHVDVLLPGFRGADKIVKLNEVSIGSSPAAISVLATV